MSDMQGAVDFDSDNRLRRQYQAWPRTPAGETTDALCRRFALEKLARGERFGIAQLVGRVRLDVPVPIEKDEAEFRVNIPRPVELVETRKNLDVRLCRDGRDVDREAIA